MMMMMMVIKQQVEEEAHAETTIRLADRCRGDDVVSFRGCIPGGLRAQQWWGPGRARSASC